MLQIVRIYSTTTHFIRAQVTKLMKEENGGIDQYLAAGLLILVAGLIGVAVLTNRQSIIDWIKGLIDSITGNKMPSGF